MSAPALSVAALDARFRVAPGAAHRGRLDGVLQLVLDDELEPALERAGASVPTELVCVRTVDAPASLALARHGDRELAAAWSEAIAAAIGGRVRDGGEDVVRFGSHRHALLDMACCIAAGDRSREWAWRLLGLWPANESDPPRALVRALLDDGGAVAAVLARLAPLGGLATLASTLPPSAWLDLATAALCSAGASRDDAVAALAGGSPRAAIPVAVRRALARSRVAAALRASGAPAAAVAALALVESEPAAVAALGERLALPGETSETALPTAIDDPELPEPGTEPSADSSLDLAPRARGESLFGGLVFALHAVRALDVPARFAADLPGEDLAAALHALAVELAVEAQPGDPAVLAFAGLAPDAPPPAQPSGASVLGAVACDVREWLAARLGLLPAELDLHALLRRRAEIVADPGWIEVHLRTDEIDTAVRRAGLDLDPDHLPFLGCVVRIVYA